VLLKIDQNYESIVIFEKDASTSRIVIIYACSIMHFISLNLYSMLCQYLLLIIAQFLQWSVVTIQLANHFDYFFLNL
jgi:hypothetical protein